MKVLLVSHNFLPAHHAGTEIYTGKLGVELAKRGHEVRVFTTEKDISRPHLSVRDREVDGLPVREVFNNLYYESFRDTWHYPPIEQSFVDFLEEFRPDVVHFQHLMYLSVGCVEEVAWRGIPVFFTLHDYWLQCPRQGQRVHYDGRICDTIDFARCGDCLGKYKFMQTPLERRTGRFVAGVRRATGLDLGAFVRNAALKVFGEPKPPVPSEQVQTTPPPLPAPEAEPLPAPEIESPPTNGSVEEHAARRSLDDRTIYMMREAIHRDFELRERLKGAVHRFLSPSRFLLERFLEWGIPEDQIRLLRTGLDPELFASIERTTSEKLRVAFIGSLIPAKGPHVLLEAWGLVPEELRARGELSIYGPVLHGPGFLRDLEAAARRVGAHMRGALEGDEVPLALSSTDLLVVPSLWYENAPLIILEAMAARTPLLVSDLGGMAELVSEGETGYYFRTGDREDLAKKLVEILSDPARLAHLYQREVHVPEFAENIDTVEELYRSAVSGREAVR